MSDSDKASIVAAEIRATTEHVVAEQNGTASARPVVKFARDTLDSMSPDHEKHLWCLGTVFGDTWAQLTAAEVETLPHCSAPSGLPSDLQSKCDSALPLVYDYMYGDGKSRRENLRTFWSSPSEVRFFLEQMPPDVLN